LSKFVALIFHPRLTRFVLAGVGALLIGPWAVASVSAGEVLGELKGTPPMSPPFINSPGSYDISSGPVTVVFTTQVENLTNHVVTETVDFNVHHVMTYYGQDVSDGQPGKPGITFKKGDAPNTTQVVYGTPFERTLTVDPKGSAPQLVTFSTVITQCGYFQFDIGKHMSNHQHNNLSTGFARVLGCKTSGGGGGGGGTGGGGTGGSGGAGGTGGVSGATGSGGQGEVLAATGLPVGGGLLGAALMLIGGLGLRFRRH
jgi:uncharacterized membrane protein YgcG